MKTANIGGSHIPTLLKILPKVNSILELGAGWNSTPLMYWYCLDKGIEFKSYETNQKWVHSLEGMAEWVDDYKDIPLRHWDMIFIDQAPASERVKAILRWKDYTDCFVIHDTEPVSRKLYQYEKIYKLFEFKSHDRRFDCHTTILSNKKEMCG